MRAFGDSHPGPPLILTPRGLRHGGQLYPCTLGRSGVTGQKREGDGATPRGDHRITAILYRPDRMSPPSRWAQPIRPSDLWSDDPADPAYNRKVRAPHPFGHERLWRGDPLYDVILVTDWNAGGLPGRGSAIFLHQWRRRGYPTEGCVALARGDLHRLARDLRPGTRLIVP